MSLSSIDGHVCWNSNHRLPFIVCQPRKTNVHFPFPFAANNVSLPFPFSICRKQRKLFFSVETWTWRHEDMDTWRHWYVKTWRQGDMDMETSNGKWKTEAQAILLNLHFIDLWLSVCRRRNKQTKWTCPMPVYAYKYKVQSPVTNHPWTLRRPCQGTSEKERQHVILREWHQKTVWVWPMAGDKKVIPCAQRGFHPHLVSFPEDDMLPFLLICLKFLWNLYSKIFLVRNRF